MARIRTIKPDFFTSADVCALSPLARLFYIACWLEADREGRMSWRPDNMKLRYFPADSCQVHEVAGELVRQGLVRPYGDGLAVIPTFTRHQVVNNRERPSVLPEPSDVDACPTRDHACATRAHGYSFPFPSFPEEKKTNENTPDGFAEFWNAYPRKVNKQGAYAVWCRLKPSEALQATIMEALEAQKVSRQWTAENGAYVPHPRTWIMGRRWEDEAQPQTQAQGIDLTAELARSAKLSEARSELLPSEQLTR